MQSAVIAYQLPRGMLTAEAPTAGSAASPAMPTATASVSGGASTAAASGPPAAAASAWGPFGLDTALLDVAALPHLCELHAAVCALQAVLGPDPLLSMLAAPGVATSQLEGAGDPGGGVESSETASEAHGGVTMRDSRQRSLRTEHRGLLEQLPQVEAP